MLTAIGRAAARRVLLPGRTVANGSKVAASTAIAFTCRSNVGFAGSVRALSISAWMHTPSAGSSTGSSKTKKTSATKKNKKPVTKKKKTTAKKSTKKPKKELTPEEKSKAELRELKKMALLKGPQLLPETAWAVYVTENVSSGQGKLTDRIKEVASSFSGLSEMEKERLKSTAQSNQGPNKTTRQQWLESYPPEAIYMANIARRRIARKLDKSRLYLIHDDRLPSRARTPYTLFIKERFAHANSESGSYTSAQDTFRAMSEQWRNMSESEKQPFKDRAAAEVEKSTVSLKELKEKARAYWKEQKGGSPGQVPS